MIKGYKKKKSEYVRNGNDDDTVTFSKTVKTEEVTTVSIEQVSIFIKQCKINKQHLQDQIDVINEELADAIELRKDLIK